MEHHNISKHTAMIGLRQRMQRFGHSSACLWFTGLSGSGKSSIAYETESMLFERKIHTYVLDGDNVRHGLNSDLGFSATDREENIRRVGEVAQLFVDAGLIVLVSFISPFRKDRNQVRTMMPAGKFIEIYVKADLETCMQRDPKGLYKKAQAGLIPDFTGVTSPYEEPESPELILDTVRNSDIAANAGLVMNYLESKGII